ncbi:MAG: hypothetical protein M5U01_15445 [Ardenticatenaceae bacterium]|nr:hypothetical protein [Ardenticatenaceae bacterium]
MNTIILFGKVPEDGQIYLSVIAFGSVAWLVALLGIVFPRVSTFLLAFVPLPEWVDENWVRLAMLAATIVIPLIVGVIGLRMLDPQDRPKDAAATAKAILKGFSYTLGLALTLIMMTAFAPALKIQTLIRRWTNQHVPIIVESEDYLEIVGEIQAALRTRGWTTTRHEATWMLRVPTKVLTLLAGGAIENLVADELTTLKAEELEVLLHPSDLVISGQKTDVIQARTTLVQQLAFSKAYLTWTKEANELEDRLWSLWREMKARARAFVPADALARLGAIGHDLDAAGVPYEEWEVLFREKQQVETALLRMMAGVTDQVAEPADITDEAPVESGLPTETLASPNGLVFRLVGLLVVAALALLNHMRQRSASP